MFWRTCALCRGLKPRANMAIYHLSASIVKRSAGRSVTAAAAYRAGSKIEDLTTGLVHDYTRKQGIDHSEILSPISANLGNEWILDREQLWNQVEQIERRKDAQLGREITIAIPVELDRASQIELVREYVRANFVDRGMIADINIHHLDGNNPHAHVLMTMRNLQTNLEGNIEFGLKNTDWNSKELLLFQRKSWELITNKYLAAAGSEAKIDCRSLEEQGSPFIPQIHVGVHAMAMKRKGIATDRSDQFDRIEAANNDIRTRLEEIYQEEYTEPQQDSDIQLENLDREKYREPELEVKPELTEQQQQQIAADRKLAELIIEVMPPNPRETQIFGIYAIKPRNNNFQVRINHNVILNLKLEDDIWVKYTRYLIKGEQRKHHYSNSDIDAKVEDFTKVIAEHQRKIDDLKIEATFEKERIRAEKERIKTEIEIQKVNREKAKAEAQIQKINNERLKPQKAEERRVRMEAQKIETKQRNLKKAEALAASQIIVNAERQIRLTAQRIEARQREIERDKIKKEEAKLASERRKAERERVSNEINKAAENICHLIQNAIYVKFDVEGSTLGIIRHSESCIKIDTTENWYTLYLGNDNNWTIREDTYNTQSINDIYEMIEKCLQIGILIFKKEEELEEVIVDVVTPLIAEQIKIISNELQNLEEVTSDIERQISTPTLLPKIRSGDVANRITLISQKLANQDEQKLEEPETIESKPVTKPETIEFKPAIEEPEKIESRLAVEDLRADSAITDPIIEEEPPIKAARINQPIIKKATKTKTRKPSRGGIE